MIKTAFSTLGCPNWSFKEILAFAGDMGYDGIEIRGINNQLYAPLIPEFSKDNLKNTLDEIKSKKLNIPVFSSGANLADKVNTDTCLKEAYDYIELAKNSNVEYVRVLCDLTPEAKNQVDFDFVCNNLKTVCEKAKQQGVKILIETNGYFAKSDNILKLLECVDCENLGVIWDVHHPFTYFDEQPEYTFNKLKKYIKHIHIKDSVKVDGKIQYKMLGYGNIPIKKVIELLKENDFDGYLSLEWVKRWAKELDDPDIVFPQFMFAVKRLLK